MGGKGLEVILAHFYARAEKGGPLVGGPGEEAVFESTSLGRGALYKKITGELNKGRSLADALGAVAGFPGYLISLIRKGEESGRLAPALKLAMTQYPLFSRYGFYIRGLLFYAAAVLLFLFGFLTVSAFEFQTIYDTVSRTIMEGFSGLNAVRTLGELRILALILTVAAAVVCFYILADGKAAGRIIQFIPLVNRNYKRLISLELGTLYYANLETGAEPRSALIEAIRSSGENQWASALGHAAASAEQSGGLIETLAYRPELKDLPVVESIGVGVAAGKEKEMAAEHNALVFDYLSANLGRDMKMLFSYLVAGCGVLVALSVMYVFNAIIGVYEFPLF